MTLTVEDGTGLALADAYVSVADADSYHAERNTSAWFDATVPVKEAAIRQATTYLDGTFEWVGAIKTLTQALAWPRTDAVGYEGRTIANDAVPQQVADATAYLAGQALSGALQPASDAGRVRSKRLGSVAVEYATGSDSSRRFFPELRSILVGLYSHGPGSISGRVVRWS